MGIQKLVWLGYVTGAATLLVCVIYLCILVSTKKYIYQNAEEIPHAQAAIVLGAAILKNGNLSPVLRDRVDAAVILYKEGKVEKIVVTGDNHTIEHNEVEPMRQYLIKAGVPDENIFLDHAGFDTYSSMYRARKVFLIDSMIIVTQSFHLPRAIFIARQIGITSYGLNADNGHYKVSNYVREIAADIKALWNVIIDRQPKFLGEEIPITGDASVTK